jgi:uncharacterized protein (TIGR03437 family)
MKRALLTAGLLMSLAPFASAYYYWTFFATQGGGPFVPVPMKFDLNPANPYGVQNQTVTYLISADGPGPLVAGDTFNAVISQIRAAAGAWNDVSTSAIRLAFGGLSPMPTTNASPEIDVVFDDSLPPGLKAQTFVTTVDPAGSLNAGAKFLPIFRSVVHLRKDLTSPYKQASSSDGFFLTVVHEFGHALGLQHTLTSSVMSTDITRGTTKARPLAADDIAGISLLYPANGYPAGMGSITGTVSLNGAGVSLASVVALATNGTSVSGFTNPDGTYRIDGVPPGQYFVYVHPLPPAQQGEAYPANVLPPQDVTGRSYAANTGFGSQFYGGSIDWTQAVQVAVGAGNSQDGVNFNVPARSGPAVSSMEVFGAVGSASVQAPPIQSGSRVSLAFFAQSSVGNTGYLTLAPGLTISVIGGTAQVEQGNMTPYPNYAPYLLLVLDTNVPVTAPTPAALAVMLNNDVYVLPAAFTVVPNAPPAITAVNGSTDNQGNSTVVVAGKNLSASTRVLFDGARAAIQSVNPDGSLTVAAPSAVGGYQATVEALADLQTSSQALGSAAPLTFLYGAPAFPSIGVATTTLVAGTDAMVEIIGYNTNFVDGQTVVGFGSSDVVVKHVWVISPGRLLMNVSVNAAATPGPTTISVAAGLQLTTLTASFQILPATSGQMSLRAPILNQATLLEGVPVGGIALINTTGLPQNLAGWTLAISNQTTQFTMGPNGQITALVPGGLVSGAQTVQLSGPGTNIAPILIQVDAPPPIIVSVSNGTALNSASNPVHAGDFVTLAVAGLQDINGGQPAASSLDVNVGGVDQAVLGVSAGPQGTSLVQFQLASGAAAGSQSVTIRMGTRVSAAITVVVR